MIAVAGGTMSASAAPAWVHLLPAGTFRGIDGRGPYAVEDAAAVIAVSTEGGRPLPIDYDHAIDLAAPSGRPAPAAGWIERLEARADGVWGLVRWTERAAAAIRALEYRFISPAFEHLRSSGKIMRLVRASLVNNPNIKLVALAAALSSGRELAFGLTPVAGALTPDEAMIVAQIGADPAVFVATKAQVELELAARRHASPLPRAGGLTPEEGHVVALMNLDPAAFLKTRAEVMVR